MQRKPTGILAFTLLTALFVLCTGSCSVISPALVQKAEPAPSLETLFTEKDRYRGKTVVLGGYVLQTRRQGNETIIEASQAPLSFRHEPKARRLSEGRLIIRHDGPLRPSAYAAGRKFTVAGELTDCTRDGAVSCEIRAVELYVWPEREYDWRYGDEAPESRILRSSFPGHWH